MAKREKRVYNSRGRQAQAAQTRSRILEVAKRLFQSEGFEVVTIENLAQAAGVSAPTIYALFQSKRGILRAIMDEALPPEHFEALVNQGKKEKSVKMRLLIAARIARQMYDAEQAQMDLFRGAQVLTSEFKELEQERERRRYNRQEQTVLEIAQQNLLLKDLTVIQARDILWAFTGRDMYRMFVIEQGWSSDTYEDWLGQVLIRNLIDEPPQEQS